MQSYSYSIPGSYSLYQSVTGKTTHYSVTKKSVNFTAVGGLKVGDRVNPTEYSFSKVVREGLPFDKSKCWVVSNNFRTETFSGDTASNFDVVGGSGLRLPQNRAMLQDRCMEKIYEQIRGQSNLIVDVAESSMTLKMLKSTLNLRKMSQEFFRDVVRGKGFRRRTSSQARLDYVTSKWLEYRYGWSPLMYSIYDAADTLLSSRIARRAVVKARSGHSNKHRESSGVGSMTDQRISRSTLLKERMEIKCIFELDSQKKIYDWTSLNPARIVWELTPLSFVADWVLNISQQLELLENRFLFEGRFKGGYRTYGYKETLVVTKEGYSGGPITYWPNGTPLSGTLYDYNLQGATRVMTHKGRERLSSLPWPGGVRVKLNVGAKRQLDAAALVHQLFAKKTRF